MFDPKRLAERLLLERRRIDIDQIELGRRASVSGGYISDIERGKVTNIGVEKLFAIASGLGVSPWYLLGQTEDPLAGVIECLYRYCAKSPLGGLFSDYRQVLALLRWEGLDL